LVGFLPVSDGLIKGIEAGVEVLIILLIQFILFFRLKQFDFF